MNEILEKALNEHRQLMEYEVYEFLESHGVHFPEYWIVDYESSISSVVEKLSKDKIYVCKAMSPKILHKSDLKAVVLNVERDEIAKTFKDFQDKFKDLDFRAMLIVEMIEDGIELLIGGAKDPSFGSIVVFGIGGTLVEVVNDVTFAKCPIADSDAELMIESIKHQNLLNGPRGLAKVNKIELTNLLKSLSQISFEYEKIIEEIDLNPVRITSNGLVPLDARLILKKRNVDKFQ